MRLNTRLSTFLWTALIGLLTALPASAQSSRDTVIRDMSKAFCGCLETQNLEGLNEAQAEAITNQCVMAGFAATAADLIALNLDLANDTVATQLGEEMALGALQICPAPFMKLSMGTQTTTSTADLRAALIDRSGTQFCGCMTRLQPSMGVTDAAIQQCSMEVTMTEMANFQAAGLSIESTPQMEQYGQDMAMSAMGKCPSIMLQYK